MNWKQWIIIMRITMDQWVSGMQLVHSLSIVSEQLIINKLLNK